MRTSHRVARNTLVLYAKTGVTMFFSLYTTRVVLQELGAEGFGVFALVGSVIAMLGFLNGSMSAATQRFMSYSHGKGEADEQRDIFNISFAMHAVAGLLMVAILLAAKPILFSNVFKIPDAHIEAAKFTYTCVAAGAFFSVISVPYVATLTARENMPYIAVVSFIESVAKLTVALVITHVSTETKLAAYGGLMAAIPLLVFTAYSIFCHLRYSECCFSRTFKQRVDLAKEMLRFGSWSLLGSFSSVLTHSSQGIALNSFFGASINAAQGITNQVSGQLGVFAMSLQKALDPVITKREGADQRRQMLEATMTGSKITFLLKAVLFIPFIVEMPAIFALWLVEIPDYAIAFCRIYLIRNMIETLTSNLTTSIASVGEIKAFQITSSIITPLPLIASIIMFYAEASPISLYIAFLIGAACLYGFAVYFCAKQCTLNISEYLTDVTVRLLITSLLIYALAMMSSHLLQNPAISIITAFIASGIAICLTSFTITFNSRESKMIRNSTHNAIEILTTKIQRKHNA